MFEALVETLEIHNYSSAQIKLLNTVSRDIMNG